MKTEDSLKKHVRFTCLNERPVSCHICEKPFIDNKSVRIHVQSVHMKEKPHLCPSCGKGFGTPISLKSHRENVHEKLKKYTCKVCGKTFGNQGNLYVHNQRHHERYVLAQFFLLKYGSEEKGSSLCKCSIILGFFMSKKLERLRSELLSEDKITNLLGFLT